MSVASKNKIAFRLLALVFFMLAMSFAAVPFYDWFCRVTGFGGVTQTAVDESDKILERNITVRFDGSLDSNIDWEFKPTQRKMTLRIGETGLAFYEAHNPTDKVIAGTASFNVYPYSAGYYFNKIQCFCFEMQVLQPGETVQMPVTFYVDPESLEIIGLNDFKNKKLNISLRHKIDKDFLNYHKKEYMKNNSVKEQI